jgi:hypothetical protein
MTISKKNLVGLAKKNKKPTIIQKNDEKPVEKNKLTATEERDLKAKETVEKLLANSPIITLDKKEEPIKIDSKDDIEEVRGVEWLEEQVLLLSEKNKLLESELVLTKEDYMKLYDEYHGNNGDVDYADNNEVKIGIINLFNELQNNHIKLGVNEQGLGNFRIYCPGFLNRMITFFPFLEEIKRY